jgi:predicted nucleic acid-binding protein
VNRLVLDANTAIDWFVTTPEGEDYSRHLESLVTSTRFLVPLHFDVEVTGHLVKKHRRHPAIFSQIWLQASLGVLDALPIDIMGQGINFTLLGNLAQAYNLTPYDVPYFHLARMAEVPIASRDRGIIAACKAWHVPHWQPLVKSGG